MKTKFEWKTPEDLVEFVAKARGLKSSDIYGKYRRAEISDARSLIARILQSQSHMSVIGIARLLKKDHSSVIHMLGRPLKFRYEDLVEDESNG